MEGGGEVVHCWGRSGCLRRLGLVWVGELESCGFCAAGEMLVVEICGFAGFWFAGGEGGLHIVGGIPWFDSWLAPIYICS